ncbi:16S rRNA (guanine(527)-N(7))-methyltransferase RsmG [Clostridium sp. CX1]|uniref:Ribosomal RNA small subunit methyltransferase G n=1 Tax=Clostridium tanneri TaxID=3037988 RepID=A0ABU4JX95_9CLOT|nr:MULTISPECIES: 16S rRNA (guanine(527)-N(7))-methyltransferase RsmG [unclassified Clostridium]MCT8977609.1 16S rRNA (guanine(527)-N(7))-methyltransferase RsmG [Clostridium sp. CX1]MDW8802779.1 16S rRNA (guanine(527)-N(7))-methyltransferase RsmG [Clostridium sp. A1-XYC3]
MDYFQIMNSACLDVQLDFNEDMYNKFMQYKDMIKEWNEKINLTAITEDEQMVKKHFIDSIKIFKFSPLREAKSIIDIGTGAGFPGIPIKLVKPDVDMTLLDSLNKRIIFLNEVINKLELKEIKTIHGRAEDFSRKIEYRQSIDVVVSRAVANLAVLSELCIPYVKIGGYFVAMKGPSVEEEIKEGKSAVSILGGKIEDIIEIEIEDSNLNHNLVVIRKVKETPKAYPRKAGTATKKPLK